MKAPYLFGFVVVCSVLITPSIAARSMIFHGEYQRVDPDKGVVTAGAKLTIPGGAKAGKQITCTAQPSDGKPVVIRYHAEDCVRKGTHILCWRDRVSKTGRTLTDVCWGDIYKWEKAGQRQ